MVAWPPAEGQVLSVRFSIALLPEHPLEELLDAAWGRSLEGVPSLAGQLRLMAERVLPRLA